MVDALGALGAEALEGLVEDQLLTLLDIVGNLLPTSQMTNQMTNLPPHIGLSLVNGLQCTLLFVRPCMTRQYTNLIYQPKQQQLRILQVLRNNPS